MLTIEPTAFEVTIMDALSQHIQHLITQQAGQISFHDFMQAALYTPELGYYMNTKPKLGIAGDFITAPEISPLFGQCLAAQIRDILPHLTHPVIIEFGAGSGKLAATLLASLAELDCLPDAYYIVEVSGYFKALQHQYLRQTCPQWLPKIHWVTTLPENCEGVVIANEVLDAMPIHIWQLHAHQVYEYYIHYEQNTWQGRFHACVNPRLHQTVLAIAQSQPKLQHYVGGYTSEANLYIQPWLASIATCLTKGSVFIFDYGFPRYEYYHIERYQGTLMCHYRHHSHTNPLILLGLQDITAHVDFTAVAEAAINLGYDVSGFTTLAYFLLGSHIHELIQSTTTQAADWQAKQAIMQLTSPSEMGELFKVIQLTKNLDLQLSGFTLKDMRYRL